MKHELSMSHCQLCQQTPTPTRITKHIQACITKHLNQPPQTTNSTFYHLQIKAYHNPQYWLQVGVRNDIDLAELDDFIRAIWVECCGHMSAFFHHDDEMEQEKTIGKSLATGMELFYRYDHGDSTELIIKVYEQYTGSLAEGVKILARNEQPQIHCDHCQQEKAIQICQECLWDDKGWLCEDCITEHTCDEDEFLPVVNSPRVGRCAYTGEIYY